LGAIPEELAESVTVLRQADGQVVLEAADSLTGLLGWLAGLPLSELRIEPVGLAVVYDHYHRNADANGRPATDPN
jgi:ABC-2 type transport system ATP-binding protein